MSIYALNKVLEHSQHKGNALVLMLVIANYADEGGKAWPRIETLRKKTKLSERQIIRLTKKIEDSGECDVTHRRNSGNVYQLRFDVLTDKKETKMSVIDGEKDPESQLITDSKSQIITDSAVSDDPSLTVKEPLINARDSVDGEVVGEDEIVEWFDDRKKSGVRSSAEELPKPPRTEAEIKDRIRNAVVRNQLRARDKNPVIEMYLAKVPEHVRPLASAFCYGRGRAPRDKEDKMWRREWQDQYELGLTSEHIEDAFEYHRIHNLSVRSPVSVLTVAENLRSGQIRMDFDRESGETSQNIAGARQVSAGDGGEDLDVMRELGFTEDDDGIDDLDG